MRITTSQYWKELKTRLEADANKIIADFKLDEDIFNLKKSDTGIELSLHFEDKAVATLSIGKEHDTIDLHTVIQPKQKEVKESYEVRDGYLASVNSDSVYFADAGHAAGNFLKLLIDALYDPPFNKPKY